MNKNLSSSLIAQAFSLNHFGPRVNIHSPSSIYNLKPFSVSWIKYPSTENLVDAKQKGNVYLILPEGDYKLKLTYSTVKNPRNIFNQIMRKFSRR